MGVSSSKLQPQELITFKRLSTDVLLDNIEIPERPENRRPTNVKWLIVLGVFILVMLPFMIYTFCYSDWKRAVVGYDQCGNVCGQQNYKWDIISCSGKDMTYKPYFQYDDYYGGEKSEELFRGRSCVESCSSGFFPLLGKCLKGFQQENYGYNSSDGGSDVEKVIFTDYFIGYGVYFESVKWQIVISCLLSILVAIGMLFLFRYAVAFIVWLILIGCLIGLLCLVVALWYFYVFMPTHPKRNNYMSNGVLIAAIIFTLMVLALGVVLIWCRNKIRLVIKLLKEATLAIFDMPGLIPLQVICVIVILVLTFLFVLTTLYMSYAGTLQEAQDDFYIYVKNPVMIFTMAYNFVVYLWLAQFFTGIQYMIIAGAISKWYFARDKSYLGRPIMTSLSNAFRFHLGTIALGALIITLVQVIKSIILGLIKNDKIKLLVKSIIDPIETFFKFLSKNSYIITAMHGQAFIRSGKRAAKLIIQNISDIIAVNFIGDFILGMAQFLIVVISVLLSLAVFFFSPGSLPHNNFMAYFIVAVVSAVVAGVTFGVFETTIDTLFICYCEDSLLNDGMARPYFMSRNMMEFVQSSKEIYGKK